MIRQRPATPLICATSRAAYWENAAACLANGPFLLNKAIKPTQMSGLAEWPNDGVLHDSLVARFMQFRCKNRASAAGGTSSFPANALGAILPLQKNIKRYRKDVEKIEEDLKKQKRYLCRGENMKTKGVIVILIFLVLIYLGYFLLTGDQLETIPPDDFNKKVADAARNKESWTGSDKLVALKFVGEEQDSEIVAQRSTGTFTDVRTEIIKAVKDDSIDSIKYKLTLHKTEEGYWIVTKAYRGFKCGKGRGHQNYSTRPCK